MKNIHTKASFFNIPLAYVAHRISSLVSDSQLNLPRNLGKSRARARAHARG